VRTRWELAWLALVFVVVLGARTAGADEVVETYPDGSPKSKTWVDPEGRRNGRRLEFFEDGKLEVDATDARDVVDGPYATFHPSGRPALRTTYRGGKLVGKHVTWDADGAPVRVATHVEGRLHGKVEHLRGRKPFATQVWKDGEIVTLNGVPVTPRPRTELDRVLAAVAAGQPTSATPPKGPTPKDPAVGRDPPGKAPKGDPTAPPVPEDLAADRVAALRRLMPYRYLCGVPYDDLVFDDEANRYAQAAAEICAALGDITHTPANPGWPPERYAFAAKGAASCDLHQLLRAAASIDGYMDDSDPSNVGRLGRRRWRLNPVMRRTGFGVALSAKGDPFTAMWAMDRDRAQGPDVDAITFPAQGWHPASMFRADDAWRVAPSERRFPRVDPVAVRVRVTALDADLVPAATALPLEAFSVQTEAVGVHPCIIFRPKGVEVRDGAAYWVEVTGRLNPAKAKQGAPPDLAFAVRFYGAPAADEAPPADDAGR